MDITQDEMDSLKLLSDNRWHRASQDLFFLHRKGLVDRRAITKPDDKQNVRYEYQINQVGKDILANLMEE